MVRGKLGPDSCNRGDPASGHTDNASASLTRPDRATDGLGARGWGAAAQGLAAGPRKTCSGFSRSWAVAVGDMNSLPPSLTHSRDIYLRSRERPEWAGPCPGSWTRNGKEDRLLTVSREVKKGARLHGSICYHLWGPAPGPKHYCFVCPPERQPIPPFSGG